MELDRCRALVCAIETGSLSAAAEALQYTPSGVSRMVAALEEETGVPLLLREHGGVRPTKECERLLPAIRELLHAGEACSQLSAQLRGLDIGTVTVGTAYSAFYSPLARITSDFHARYGGIFRCSCAADTAQSCSTSSTRTGSTCASSPRARADTTGCVSVTMH